jgi:hypothetical protein
LSKPFGHGFARVPHVTERGEACPQRRNRNKENVLKCLKFKKGNRQLGTGTCNPGAAG